MLSLRFAPEDVILLPNLTGALLLLHVAGFFSTLRRFAALAMGPSLMVQSIAVSLKFVPKFKAMGPSSLTCALLGEVLRVKMLRPSTVCWWRVVNNDPKSRLVPFTPNASMLFGSFPALVML